MASMARFRPGPTALRLAAGRGELLPRPSVRALQTRCVATNAALREEVNVPSAPTPLPERVLERKAAIKNAKPFSDFLTDNFQREHDYLRISITERCNLRCLYCMPEEGIPLSPPANMLTTPEIFYLSSLFVSQGVTKIRLTGGEPTVRRDIVPLMQQLGSLRPKGLRELALTTNGISLHRKLDAMAEAGLTGVNLSLDTLDPFQFQIMTRRKGFDAVMKSIDRILEMNKLGANIKLKVNCVVMRGLNEREILPFVEMGREKDIEVRFIEYMPFGGNKWSENKMISFQEMVDIIRTKYPGLERVPGHKNDTSKTYKVPGFVGRVGFITSMTNDFCGTCNRLRITSDGNLKVCLHGNDEVSLRDLLRKDNGGDPIDQEAFERIKQIEMDRRDGRLSDETILGWGPREQELLNVIGVAVKRKAEKHADMGDLANMTNRPMILIDKTVRQQSTIPSHGISRPIRRPSVSRSAFNILQSNVFLNPLLTSNSTTVRTLHTIQQLRRRRRSAKLQQTITSNMVLQILEPDTALQQKQSRKNVLETAATARAAWRRKKNIARTVKQAEEMDQTRASLSPTELRQFKVNSPLHESEIVPSSDTATTPSELEQLQHLEDSISRPPRPLSDALRAYLPRSNTIYIDKNLTVDFAAPITELQSQVSKMHGRLTTSFADTEPLPFDVWKSRRPKTLKTWLKILVARWQARVGGGGVKAEEVAKKREVIGAAVVEAADAKPVVSEAAAELGTAKATTTESATIKSTATKSAAAESTAAVPAVAETTAKDNSAKSAVNTTSEVSQKKKPINLAKPPTTEVAQENLSTIRKIKFDSLESNDTTNPVVPTIETTNNDTLLPPVPRAATERPPARQASEQELIVQKAPISEHAGKKALHITVEPAAKMVPEVQIIRTEGFTIRKIRSQRSSMSSMSSMNSSSIDSSSMNSMNSIVKEVPVKRFKWNQVLGPTLSAQEALQKVRTQPIDKGAEELKPGEENMEKPKAPINWEELDAGGLGFLIDETKIKKTRTEPDTANQEKAKSEETGTRKIESLPRSSKKSIQQKRVIKPEGKTLREFKAALRRAYSTSTRPPPDQSLTPSEGSSSKSSVAPSTQNPPLPTALPHLTSTGSAHMVSVSTKAHTTRTATAVGTVHFTNPTPLSLIQRNALQKGDVLSVSRIAGIMAAKKCPDLIPLCHPIALTHVGVEVRAFGADDAALASASEKVGEHGGVLIEATVQCTGPTGVEMEALTAVMGAALSVVDMCKAVDKFQRVDGVRVVLKEGGKSGTWKEEGWKSCV